MLEEIFGLERISIQQCELLAKKLDHDGATFDLVGPLGRKSCKWLDAYMGLFQIDEMPGFLMTNDPRIAFCPGSVVREYDARRARRSGQDSDYNRGMKWTLLSLM